MKILCVHNRYQHAGGEDTVFEAEVDLLQRYGHEVEAVTFSNDVIPEKPSPTQALSLAVNTVWSTSSRAEIRRITGRYQPDIVHFHNTFPLLSPGIYSAARERGAAIVQTLHNYRLICPGATLFRDGGPCEECVGKRLAVPSIKHACYRGSRSQSAVVAAMLGVHRLRRTWSRDVDQFIALSEFSRGKLSHAGIPVNKLATKPNFVDIPDEPSNRRDHTFLYVGRLSSEKGPEILLDATPRVDSDVVRIRMCGDGPLMPLATERARETDRLVLLGRRTPDEVREEMRSAQALILPSNNYENFPMTIAEAFACGLPVIASGHGAMAELIQDHQTGLLFTPGDADSLAATILWASNHPHEMKEMGARARSEYEAKYTPAKNHSLLMDIYHRAISHRHGTKSGTENVQDKRQSAMYGLGDT